MKQTAVEWLIQEYINSSFINIQIMKKALEMEKEQIVEAHNCGYSEGIYQSCESGEQYYNETFKSE